MTLLAVVVASVAAIGTAHLVAYYRGWPLAAGALKAVPIALLAGMVLAIAPPERQLYATLIATGLVCSAVGDICLLRAAWFGPGVASFALAHGCYLSAFAGAGPPIAPALGWLLALLAIAGLLGGVLWPYLVGWRRPAVVGYIAIITLMAWTAVSRASTAGIDSTSGLAAAGGALLFMASDALLALDRFRRRIPGAHAGVMTIYYAAQTAIAASVV